MQNFLIRLSQQRKIIGNFSQELYILFVVNSLLKKTKEETLKTQIEIKNKTFSL